VLLVKGWRGGAGRWSPGQHPLLDIREIRAGHGGLLRSLHHPQPRAELSQTQAQTGGGGRHQLIAGEQSGTHKPKTEIRAGLTVTGAEHHLTDCHRIHRTKEVIAKRFFSRN
jgi:hypothetical protein